MKITFWPKIETPEINQGEARKTRAAATLGRTKTSAADRSAGRHAVALQGFSTKRCEFH